MTAADVLPGTGETAKPIDDPDRLSVFKDITGHWAESTIIKAVEQGVVNGYPDDTFKPDRTVARAEFAVMLMNALKPSVKGSQLSFQDSNTIGLWATQSVSKCVELGIITGYPAGTFRPNKTINHAEMIVMIVRAANLSFNENETTGYIDDAEIPTWAKGAIAVAELYSIPGYITDNRFKSNDLSTRAESITSILNMMNIIKKE